MRQQLLLCSIGLFTSLPIKNQPLSGSTIFLVV